MSRYLPAGSVLEFEGAVRIGHRVVGMIEDAHPAVHPGMDVALDLDGQPVGHQALDVDGTARGDEDIVARVGVAGLPVHLKLWAMAALFLATSTWPSRKAMACGMKGAQGLVHDDLVLPWAP